MHKQREIDSLLSEIEALKDQLKQLGERAATLESMIARDNEKAREQNPGLSSGDQGREYFDED